MELYERAGVFSEIKALFCFVIIHGHHPPRVDDLNGDQMIIHFKAIIHPSQRSLAPRLTRYDVHYQAWFVSSMS